MRFAVARHLLMLSPASSSDRSEVIRRLVELGLKAKRNERARTRTIPAADALADGAATTAARAHTPAGPDTRLKAKK
jgi:hypothetical protein